MSEEPMQHEKPTTATIDRRVERLEIGQAATDRKVDILTERLGYMDELLRLRFSTIEAGQAAQSAKLDVFITRMDSLISEGTKQAGDLGASPVGRQIDRRITNLETLAETNKTRIDEQNGALLFLRGLAVVATALGGLATVIALFHPVLRIP